MKAVGINAFGGRERLEWMEAPLPEPLEGEIRIRLKAAAVNPVDWKIREGRLKDRMPHAFPIILGWDGAGVVEALGRGAKRFNAGDEVYAYCRKAVVRDGTYAEYIVLAENNASSKPSNLSFEEAASVPLAALTAYQCLLGAARLKQDETVLVHAAAGGVGHFAVQMAKHRGARVLGTARSSHHRFLKGLGVDEPVDYAVGDFARAVRRILPDGVDVVLDALGGETLERSAGVLSERGRLVSIVDPPGVESLKAAGVEAHYVFVAPDSEQLAQITRLIESGRLRVHVEAVLPLSEVKQAHERIESGRTTGKIALTVP